MKSGQSLLHPFLTSRQAWKSLPVRQAGVIQTFYDIVKAHGGVPIAIGIGMKVETPPAGRAGKEGESTTFTVQLQTA